MGFILFKVTAPLKLNTMIISIKFNTDDQGTYKVVTRHLGKFHPLTKEGKEENRKWDELRERLSRTENLQFSGQELLLYRKQDCFNSKL